MMTTPLTPDQQDLVSTHMGYALRVAQRLTAHVPWLREDAESAALEALCLQAPRYQPDRGLPFRSFVARRIAGSVQDLIRAAPLVGKLRSGYSRPLAFPMRTPVGFDEDGCSYTYEDLIPGRDPLPQDVAESSDGFMYLLSFLKERPRCYALFQLVYGQGITVAEASHRVGVTIGTSWHLHAESLAHLRRALARLGRTSG